MLSPRLPQFLFVIVSYEVDEFATVVGVFGTYDEAKQAVEKAKSLTSYDYEIYTVRTGVINIERD